MRKIAVVNQKGGVGKTTSTLNIAAGLSRRKKRVMLIDLDPQAHLTCSLGITTAEIENSIYDVLTDAATLTEASMIREGMAVIPTALSLSAAEIELITEPGKEFRLKNSVDRLAGYDYLFIDCPPSLGILTVNALTAVNEIFIPLQAEFLALQGMSHLIKTIEIVKQRLNPNLEISGIIATRFDRRRKLSNEVIETISQYFGEKLFTTRIRENVSLAEAPSFGCSIFEYKPRSNGAKDYTQLCQEILKKE